MLHHGLRYLAARDAGVSNWRTHCRSESVERIRECLQSHKTFYINPEEERGGEEREKQGVGVETTTPRLLKVQRQAQNLAQNYDSALQEYYLC